MKPYLSLLFIILLSKISLAGESSCNLHFTTLKNHTQNNKEIKKVIKQFEKENSFIWARLKSQLEIGYDVHLKNSTSSMEIMEEYIDLIGIDNINSLSKIPVELSNIQKRLISQEMVEYSRLFKEAPFFNKAQIATKMDRIIKGHTQIFSWNLVEKEYYILKIRNFEHQSNYILKNSDPQGNFTKTDIIMLKKLEDLKVTSRFTAREVAVKNYLKFITPDLKSTKSSYFNKFAVFLPEEQLSKLKFYASNLKPNSLKELETVISHDKNFIKFLEKLKDFNCLSFEIQLQCLDAFETILKRYKDIDFQPKTLIMSLFKEESKKLDYSSLFKEERKKLNDVIASSVMSGKIIRTIRSSGISFEDLREAGNNLRLYIKHLEIKGFSKEEIEKELYADILFLLRKRGKDIKSSDIIEKSLNAVKDLGTENVHIEALQRFYKEIEPDEVKKITRKRIFVSQLSYSPLKQLKGRPTSEIENILKNNKIINVEPLGGGINDSFVINLGGEVKAVWKPHKETWSSNYRAEVLAYEVDRKFGFNLIPETVERTIDGKKGSVQLFKELGYGLSGPSLAPRSQLKKQSFLDFIIDNRDRHEQNYLMNWDKTVISIDNEMSFTTGGNNHHTFFERRPDIREFLRTSEGKEIVRKFENTDLEAFREELRLYLGTKDANRQIDRIKFVIKYYEDI